MKPELAAKTIEALVNAFKTQEFPQKLAYSLIHRSPEEDRLFPCRSWSFFNRMIMLANLTDTAMGFRQWQQLHRHVVKGAKAFYILVPLIKQYPVRTKPDATKSTVSSKLHVSSAVSDAADKMDKTDSTEITFQKRVYGFKPVPVFRYEDTDGEPLPVKESYKPVYAPAFIEEAKKIGVRVDYGPIYANFLGYYSSQEKRIHLCSHSDVVFFHELAHAMHDYLGLAQHRDTGRKEVVAEFSAAVLAHCAGISGYEFQAYRYIAKYAEGAEPEQVLHTIASVSKDIESVVIAVLTMADSLTPETK